jgi:L-threonylcarbamoyladenylate synthase
MPTETVYGIAAPTHDVEALEHIYALKGRPTDNPLIAHVTNAEMAQSVVRAWTQHAQHLTDELWPGPLTLILPKHQHVPSIATAQLPTIAVRAPAHAVAQALIEMIGRPLSAPSANRSGRVSPTCAMHVIEDYKSIDVADKLQVLDGGPCTVGLESTVLSLATPQPQLLRPGSVSKQTIESIIGPILDIDSQCQNASPGSSRQHYAPQTNVQLIDEAIQINNAEQAQNHNNTVFIAMEDVVLPQGSNWLMLPKNPSVAGASLYALLREADALAREHSATTITIIAPPNTPPWRAIRDRLHRAAVNR